MVTSLPRDAQPGILPTIDALASSEKTRTKNYVLAVDGKQIAQGLTPHSGDINMFGHEDKPTLVERN